MRELLTAQETTKILGLRTTTQLYKIVDFFDSDPEDEWDLVEGEHFEFADASGGEKKRKFYEEGVEAIAEYLDKDTPTIIKALGELITRKRRKRKQLLVSRRITQELIEAGSLVKVSGELGFVTQRTCISILQTNGIWLKVNTLNLQVLLVERREESFMRKGLRQRSDQTSPRTTKELKVFNLMIILEPEKAEFTSLFV